jgi:hypothetical protein
MTATAVERVAKPPKLCPRCGRDNEKRVGWQQYKLIPDAPAAGCGNCGYIVYITREAYIDVRNRQRSVVSKAVVEGKAKFRKGK